MRTLVGLLASLVAVGLVLVSGATAWAADEKPVRSISVTGTVEVQTAPDTIVWSISLSDTDKDLVTAKKKNDDKVKAVLALRQKLGVKEGDCETSPIYVHRDYERDERGGQGAFKGFVVSRGITMRQHDLKRFDEFLDSLVSSTEMEVSYNFESSKMAEMRAEARLKALKVAKDKAAAMAAVYGAKLGQVLAIADHSAGSGWGSYMAQNNGYVGEARLAADVASPTFVPGQISDRVTVYVTFSLE
jgi:uncharacterized protein